MSVAQSVGMKINIKSAWKAKKIFNCMITLLLLFCFYCCLKNDHFP